MNTNSSDPNNRNTSGGAQFEAPTFVPPLSSAAQHAIATRGTPSTLNLQEIFGDCFFTPDGDAVFLTEEDESIKDHFQISGEVAWTNYASRPVVPTTTGVVPSQSSSSSQPLLLPQQQQKQFAPVPIAGGIATTGLQDPKARATVMGPATTTNTAVPNGGVVSVSVPIVNPPQQKHHIQFATMQSSSSATTAGTKRKGAIMTTTNNSVINTKDKKANDQQKNERRERNREHAKRSRIRKKFLLESLQQSVALLKEENEKLRTSIRTHLGTTQAEELLQKEKLSEFAESAQTNLITSNNVKDANRVLDDPDFSFIKALQTAQQNFVVTDPSLPDNPIVYATQGFLNLTGYTLDQVLGRNCRFLQGPDTDPKAVEKIRNAIEEGTDMSVCLLNYRVDGTTFWNQFFIAALRDAAGNVTNYVGVQCKVSDQYAANVCKKQEEDDALAAAGDGYDGFDDDGNDDDDDDE